MFKKLLVCVVLSGLFISPVLAELGQRVNSILSKPTQKRVDYGIVVMRADTGETVYEHNSVSPMTPASNMKLVTSAAALTTLGPDYEFKTQVGLSGNRLVIIGGGDPLLGDPETDRKYGRAAGWLIDDIIGVLKRNNVTSIKDIIVDRSIFDNNCVHPSWPKDQLDCWYASQVCGLNYNLNCIDVVAKAGNGKAIVTCDPQTSYITLENRTGPSKAKKAGVWCNRDNGSNNITVSGQAGKVPVRMQITVDNPAGLLPFLIAENLPKAGIQVEGKLYERPIVPADQVTIIAEYKTSIKDVLARCNKNSLQLAAESLLKLVSAYNRLDKKHGNWEHSHKVIGAYLESLGVKPEEFKLDDGCGLSSENKLSAHALATVVLSMYKSPNWKVFSESLAIGGTDGTMHRYFKEGRYKGKIVGKTGFINGVKTLSGVCTTDKGDYVFSILTNNAAGDSRDTINDIVESIMDENSNTPLPPKKMVKRKAKLVKLESRSGK